MATTPTSLYPFATQDSQSIPLDIIKPTALMKRDFSNTPASITLTEAFRYSVFFANADCWVDALNDGSATPADGVVKTGWIFVPKDYLVTAEVVPGTMRVINADLDVSTGRLVIQGFVRWDALALPIQYNRKTS